MGQNLGPLNIKDSYQSLVQVSGSGLPSGSYLTDGTGSRVTAIDVTASYAWVADSADIAGQATSASYASTATSASYALTSSYALNAAGATIDSGSFMITGSVAGQTLTFEKGDGSTFDLVVSATGSPAESLITASVVDATITFEKGDASTFDITVNNVVSASHSDSAITANTSTTAGFASAAATASYVEGANVDGAVANATNAVSASYAVNATSADSATTATSATSASHADNASTAVSATTASHADIAADLMSNAEISITSITASNANFTNLTATSASIGFLQTVTGSATIIGDAFILLNTSDAQRYAGLKVEDSGSATPINYTASLQYDSVTNDWFYEYSGSDPTNHGVVMFGPEYGTIGSPVYPTANTILKGDGGHHIEDSNITDNGTLVSINSNTEITGGLDLTGDISASVIEASTNFAGDLIGTASYADASTTAISATSATSASYALTATSADSATTATSASYATNASTADSATSSSYALTASYAENAAGGAAFPYTGSAGISGSLTVNDKFEVTGSVNGSSLFGWVAKSGTTTELSDFNNLSFIVNNIGGCYINPAQGLNVVMASSGVNIDSGFGNQNVVLASQNTRLGSQNNIYGCVAIADSTSTIQGPNQEAVLLSTNGCTFKPDYFNGPKAIIGAYSATMQDNVTGSVILGGSGLNGDRSGFVFVPNLSATGVVEVSGSIAILSGSFSGSAVNNITDTYGTASVNHIVTLTQAQYNAISASADPNTYYIVEDGANNFEDVTVDGYLRGNVEAITVASSTASLDLASANFFTVSASAGANTHVVATNIPTNGQTVNVKLQQGATTGSFTWADDFKFPTGSAFTGSAVGGAVDIVSFITFDNSTLYANFIENLV